jgi:hypothetical protein
MSGTVRSNILLSKDYDPTRYQTVITACCLQQGDSPALLGLRPSPRTNSQCLPRPGSVQVVLAPPSSPLPHPHMLAQILMRLTTATLLRSGSGE